MPILVKSDDVRRGRKVTGDTGVNGLKAEIKGSPRILQTANDGRKPKTANVWCGSYINQLPECISLPSRDKSCEANN